MGQVVIELGWENWSAWERLACVRSYLREQMPFALLAELHKGLINPMTPTSHA